jgi:hypothetical protein
MAHQIDLFCMLQLADAGGLEADQVAMCAITVASGCNGACCLLRSVDDLIDSERSRRRIG